MDSRQWTVDSSSQTSPPFSGSGDASPLTPWTTVDWVAVGVGRSDRERVRGPLY